MVLYAIVKKLGEKMSRAKEKIAEWLKNNPDGWLMQSFTSISEEIDGVSATSVDRYLPELIADRDDILPSQVMQKRQEAGMTYPGKSRVDFQKVREIIENNPDAPVRDLVYLAKCGPSTIKKVRKAIEEENQSTDSESESNTDSESESNSKEAEIEKLKAQIAELSNS